MTYNLLLGDCLEQLKTLPDCSVDSIVTDPPYGISFMNRKWDYNVPSVEIWKECLRVLKPGGHLLSFAGTRTQHRMAINIEDAGFEIRDLIMWAYGCLSDDTNIVTPDGEKAYTAIKTGDLVLCYDKYNKEYSYQQVEDVYEYNVKDTAYRIQSDFTDQIVSRNHRCLVERDGREVFVFAEELETQENIPFLEDLPSLQSTLSNSHKRTSNQKENLLKRLRQSFDWFKKRWEQTVGPAFWYGTSSLFSLWNCLLPQQKAFGTSGKSGMFLPMQWSFSGGRMEETRSQGKEKLETRIGTSIYIQNDWRNESKLEGRNNLQTPKRKSQGGEIYSLPEGILGYGTERWLHNGTSVINGSTSRKITNTNGSSSSYQPRCVGQPNRKSNVIYKQPRSQTIREWGGHKTTLATITPFEYEGKIWCVKVPTGSFVAVRNGKVFTTGNSGFPKSQNISLAMDKKSGTIGNRGSAFRTAGAGDREDIQGKNGVCGMAYTTAITPEAQQWQGWGTGLKPALEPVTMARKPLEGTVANNVLTYGTGAINIDGCRVNHNEPIKLIKAQIGGDKVYGQGGRRGDTTELKENGRWPANLIHSGEEEVVSLFPKTGVSRGGAAFIGARGGNTYQSEQGGTEARDPGYGDSGSAARFFYCAKASKSERGENNNHPTVKPIKLMQYLCRLVTQPEGIVLDPFMGSGTTGIAALKENFNFIGIEREEEYFKIAQTRISNEESSSIGPLDQISAGL